MQTIVQLTLLCGSLAATECLLVEEQASLAKESSAFGLDPHFNELNGDTKGEPLGGAAPIIYSMPMPCAMRRPAFAISLVQMVPIELAGIMLLAGLTGISQSVSSDSLVQSGVM